MPDEEGPLLDMLRKASGDGDIELLREGMRVIAQALLDLEAKRQAPGGPGAAQGSVDDPEAERTGAGRQRTEPGIGPGLGGSVPHPPAGGGAPTSAGSRASPGLRDGGGAELADVEAVPPNPAGSQPVAGRRPAGSPRAGEAGGDGSAPQQAGPGEVEVRTPGSPSRPPQPPGVHAPEVAAAAAGESRDRAAGTAGTDQRGDEDRPAAAGAPAPGGQSGTAHPLPAPAPARDHDHGEPTSPPATVTAGPQPEAGDKVEQTSRPSVPDAPWRAAGNDGGPGLGAAAANLSLNGTGIRAGAAASARIAMANGAAGGHEDDAVRGAPPPGEGASGSETAGAGDSARSGGVGSAEPAAGEPGSPAAGGSNASRETGHAPDPAPADAAASGRERRPPDGPAHPAAPGPAASAADPLRAASPASWAPSRDGDRAGRPGQASARSGGGPSSLYDRLRSRDGVAPGAHPSLAGGSVATAGGLGRPGAGTPTSALEPVTAAAQAAATASDRYRTLKTQIQRRLIDDVDPDWLLGGALTADRRQFVIDRIADYLREERVNPTDYAELTAALLAEMLGYGPIQALLEDPGIDEIMVNGPRQVYVERSGRLELSDVTFEDDRQVMQIIERIVAPLGRRIDEASPMVDARLPDGSRVNAIIPPLSLHGPTLTIRKFARRPLQVEDLVRGGTLTHSVATFLDTCVRGRMNLIVSGATSSGKTTTLNVLSSFIPAEDRIVTIEDAAELQLRQTHVVALETRPPNTEGRGEVTVRELVRNALRMRPDRIIVGEVRAGEALDMLQAMNTGHDGSLTTLHSNGPRDTLARLETMVLMAGFDLPMRAIREQIAAAIDLIVHQARGRDGRRRVTHVTEVQGMEGEQIVLQDIFLFEESPEGGAFRATGMRPRFAERLSAVGFPLAPELFA